MKAPQLLSLACACLATCLCAHMTVAAPIVPAGYTHEQLNAAIEAAQSRGETLYKHDRAMSVATAEMLKFRAFKGDRRVVGWVTEEKDGQSILVTAVGGAEGKDPQALYRVTVDKDGDLEGNPVRLKVPEPLTEFESGAATARRVALASGFESCSPRYSTVVLATESGAERSWTVFLLPEASKANVVPMGGTHRVELDWYSERQLSTRSFASKCFELPYNSSMAALYVTHTLDPAPTEAHVYWNLRVGIPLIINTTKDDLLWAIEKGVIRQMDSGTPQRKSSAQP